MEGLAANFGILVYPNLLWKADRAPWNTRGRHHRQRLRAADPGGRETDAGCDPLGVDGSGRSWWQSPSGSSCIGRDWQYREIEKFGTLTVGSSGGPQVIDTKGLGA